MRVSEIMKRDPVTLDASQTIATAKAVMSARRIRHLPITEGGRLVGVLTERDVFRAMNDIRLSSVDIIISEVMTRAVATVRPGDSIGHALDVMLPAKLGCLPVVAANRELIGLVTATDLLQFARRLANDLEERAERDEEPASPS